MTIQEGIRIQDDIIQLRTLELVHPEYQNTVSLVGMTHVAAPEFYAHVGEYIARCEMHGAAVLCEGLRPFATPDRKDQAYVKKDRKATRHMMSMMGRLGLVGQHTGLPSKAHWENGDASLDDLVAKLPRFKELDDMPSGLAATVNAIARVVPKRLMYRLFTDVLISVENESDQTEERQQLEEVMVDFRDKTVLSALATRLAKQPRQNVVMPWGVGHQPSQSAGVQAMGFELANELWFNAMPKKYGGNMPKIAS
jgi:hypothetical protein